VVKVRIRWVDVTVVLRGHHTRGVVPLARAARVRGIPRVRVRVGVRVRVRVRIRIRVRVRVRVVRG